jgi:hypothetical protein
MKRMILSFFLASAFCFTQPGADEINPVIEFMPFVIEGLGPEEARFISALIQSYAASIGEVALRHDPSAGEGENRDASVLAAETTRKPDFILSGSITVEQDNRILSLQVVKTATGETIHHTSIHKTTTDLTLKVRSLIEAVFSTGINRAFAEDLPPETMTEGKILGIWRGDTGVEIVRLQRGGTGIAILSSGAQMNLIYRIENNALRIFQISANTERFYHPLPFNIARTLSVQAEPWQYEFFLYEDGTTLRGTKTFTDVVYEGVRILELHPGSVRAAEWTKASR